MLTSLIMIFALFFSTLAHAHLNPPQYIALVPPDNNLEYENRIEELCPKTLPNVAKCKEEKLRAKTWTIKVYENASVDSKSLGKILVTGIPGKGLTAQYAPIEGTPKDFPSDSKNTDWGYSSFFEFTVSKTNGDWIQLPKRPFQTPVWINLNKDWHKKNDSEILPTPQTLETDTVYTRSKARRHRHNWF